MYGSKIPVYKYLYGIRYLYLYTRSSCKDGEIHEIHQNIGKTQFFSNWNIIIWITSMLFISDIFRAVEASVASSHFPASFVRFSYLVFEETCLNSALSTHSTMFPCSFKSQYPIEYPRTCVPKPSMFFRWPGCLPLHPILQLRSGTCFNSLSPPKQENQPDADLFIWRRWCSPRECRPGMLRIGISMNINFCIISGDFSQPKDLDMNQDLWVTVFLEMIFLKSKDSGFFLASINLSLESLEEFKADSFLVWDQLKWWFRFYPMNWLTKMQYKFTSYPWSYSNFQKRRFPYADAAVQLPSPDATSESAQTTSAKMMQKHAEGICDPCYWISMDGDATDGDWSEWFLDHTNVFSMDW